MTLINLPNKLTHYIQQQNIVYVPHTEVTLINVPNKVTYYIQEHIIVCVPHTKTRDDVRKLSNQQNQLSTDSIPKSKWLNSYTSTCALYSGSCKDIIKLKTNFFQVLSCGCSLRSTIDHTLCTWYSANIS